MLNGWLKNTTDMETNFNFKSQVCTDKNQSERLLALGLKPETADCMIIIKSNYVKHQPRVVFGYDNVLANTSGFEVIPAWSLDRLRELIPENIFTGVRNQWHRVMYNGILTYEEGDDSLVSFREANIYDRCISCVEWLIKEGCFPKEYLV